jgi:hypothetical protein
MSSFVFQMMEVPSVRVMFFFPMLQVLMLVVLYLAFITKLVVVFFVFYYS